MKYKIIILDDEIHTIEETYIKSESRKEAERFAKGRAKGNRFYINEATSIESEDSKSVIYSPKVVATSKLAKVEIAAEDCNIGGKEVDGRHYFTFDEALELQEKLKDTGWRLPTRSEWVLICEEFGQTDGELNPQTLYKNLNMSPTGFYDYEDGKLYNRTTVGYWWSTTRSSATNANYLGTSTTYVYPQNSNYRGYGFALRLVRDVEEEEE